MTTSDSPNSDLFISNDGDVGLSAAYRLLQIHQLGSNK